METFSKGVHRALIPLESQTNQAIAVELAEASPGYRMLTQMDVISFLREQNQELKGVLSHSVLELGAISEVIFSVSKHTKVMDTIRSMRAAGLSAVPVVEAPTDDQILQDVMNASVQHYLVVRFDVHDILFGSFSILTEDLL